MKPKMAQFFFRLFDDKNPRMQTIQTCDFSTSFSFFKDLNKIEFQHSHHLRKKLYSNLIF